MADYSQPDYGALLEFYQGHLETSVLPFWLKRGIDQEYGGFFTCFDNRGNRLVSTDKYIWSQGRFIWLLARLADLSRQGLVHQDADTILDTARRGVEFVDAHAFLGNGSCAFLVDRLGNWKESVPGMGFDTSFFADCFVVLGFSEYARVVRDVSVLERALQLYDWIVQRVEAGAIRSEPYPIPPGHHAHSVPMIMLNVSQELAAALEGFQHPRSGEVRGRAWTYLETIMDRFRQQDGTIAEMIPSDDSLETGVGTVPDTVLRRHVTPGHMLESMWFVMTEAERAGDKERIRQAAQVIVRAFEVGWDREQGGLLRYVDRTGQREPQGAMVGDPYESLVLETWDTKLWWPHSEALYSTFLAYALTGEQSHLKLYELAQDYVFRTFPNPDRTIGEWIQIRDRRGEPLDKVVALPVKDPYHIIRNLLLLIELLHRLTLTAGRPEDTKTTRGDNPASDAFRPTAPPA